MLHHLGRAGWSAPQPREPGSAGGGVFAPLAARPRDAVDKSSTNQVGSQPTPHFWVIQADVAAGQFSHARARGARRPRPA
jgi:hypothetical protein